MLSNFKFIAEQYPVTLNDQKGERLKKEETTKAWTTKNLLKSVSRAAAAYGRQLKRGII